MDNTTQSPEFKDVRELFRQAEAQVKVVENLRNALVVPAINQLRYAGYHVLAAITNQQSDCYDEDGCFNDSQHDDDNDDIKKAKCHCLRAIYDASEIGVSYCIDRINKFKIDYENTQITDIVQDYLDILADTKEAQTTLNSASMKKSRHEYAQACQEHVTVLAAHLDKLDLARVELNKKRRFDRRNFFLQIAGVLIGAVTLLFTLS